MGYKDLAKSYSKTVEPPASGGGLSQNGKFSYGYASSAGKRSSMEDFFETRIDGIDGEIVGLFGVFDGHGGARAAEYVKRHLFSNLITHPKFISDTKSAIADAYNHTDSELLKSENSHTRDAGSTASTAILVGGRLLVANVGDSRAVICRGGNAFAVSRDHKPDQSDERERIENAGGFVMWAGTWRVGGVLAVSRAFGDRLLKQYVVADPEIQEEKIDDSLEFLILASDGLWDVFSNEEAVAVVKEVEDPEESTKKLVGEAIRRGSADNITCVVVRFLERNTGNNKASDVSSTHASSSQEPNQGKTAVKNDSDHKISAKETNQDHTAVHSDSNSNSENENLNQKPIDSRHVSSTQKPIAIQAAERSVPSEQSGSANEKNQMPIAIRSDSEPKSSGKLPSQGQITVHNDLDRYSENQNLNQKPIDSRHISLNQKPVATKAAERSVFSEQSVSAGEKNQKPIAIRSGSEPKSSANVPGQGQMTVHKDLDRNAENENLNQQPIAARSDDSGHISSTKKPIAITAAERSVSSEQSASAGEKNQKPITIHSSSDPKSSGKQFSQGQITVHSDLDCNAASENLNQKPIAARSDNSTHGRSTKLPIAITAAERSISSEQRGLAGEKNQMPITICSGPKPKSSAKVPGQGQIDSDHISLNQKPIAITAAERSISSDQSGLASEKNQKPIAIHSSSEPKSSGKQPSQGQITTVHKDLDRNAGSENLNQKPIEARSDDSGHISSAKKPIAITAVERSVSSEQSGLASEKNQKPIGICSGSEPNSSAKVLSQGQITANDDLDRRIAYQKQKIAATHKTYSQQSRSTGEKNREPIAVHSDSATNKASSVPSISN